jgi:broad specificity phosphatase PhoE
MFKKDLEELIDILSKLREGRYSDYHGTKATELFGRLADAMENNRVREPTDGRTTEESFQRFMKFLLRIG